MSIQPQGRARRRWRLLGALLPLIALAISGCAGDANATTAAKPVPLKLVGAKLEANPKGYTGACGATQEITFTATLTANANNQGGVVHYVWNINQAPSEADVTFARGDTTKTITRKLSYAVPADSGPELRASIATTTPNTVSSDAVFSIGCTVPFQIADVNVTLQPWTTGCGPQTFGWSAILTAPVNNTGGTARFSWSFAVGDGEDGSVTFQPGQVTQVVTIARTYTVVPHGALPPPSSQWPVVSSGQIRGSLYVYSPNDIGDYAVPEAVYC